MSDTRLSGVVKSLNIERKFGFIRVDLDARGQQPEDRFFHCTGLRSGLDFNTLTIGDRVTFRPERHHAKGPRAEDVAIEE